MQPTATDVALSVVGVNVYLSVGPFHLPAPQSGTLSRILSGTPTISVTCFRRLLKTSMFARYYCIKRIRDS